MRSTCLSWHVDYLTLMIAAQALAEKLMVAESGTARVRIAVDIGGTFTDLQVFDEARGQLHELKTPTTPADPAEGLVTGMVQAADRFGFDLADVSILLHGTTIATNAVLERKFPSGALVTTEGFEDVLEIGRHMRRDVYGLYAEERVLLVPRSRRFGLRERVGADGRVNVPLDEAQADRLVQEIVDCGCETVAVCLLNGFMNPAHEIAFRDLLVEVAPHLEVSIATDISPEIREYERSSTTVLNALLMPVVRAYVERLEARLADSGANPRVLLIQSNGGMFTPDVAAHQPARLLLSGPCGGAIAAEYLSRALEIENLIAVDMGGTSFDVSLVCEGQAALVTEGEVDGCPVRLPMVEMRTIGAGGGSIARVDDSGRLRVGPESAGADPGPACYGAGGANATVSDANLILGRLLPSAFLGGAMALDHQAALAAVTECVGDPLGLTPEAAAEGVIEIANATMANAMRLSLFEKGFDPADFALVAFGGAGGLHAAALAEELGMTRIVFPRSAGTLSAFGMLWTDIVHHAARSRILPALPESLDALRQNAEALLVEGRAALGADGIDGEFWELTLSADARYVGQGYELTIPWSGLELDKDSLATCIAAFHEAHRARFFHADESEPVEIVTLRVEARGRLERPDAVAPILPSIEGKTTEHSVYLDGEWRDLPVHSRSQMATGRGYAGPLLITEEFTTILVSSGWRLELRETGDLVAERA